MLVAALPRTVKRESKQPQALLWDYESWLWVRMRRGGGVLFFPSSAGRLCAALGQTLAASSQNTRSLFSAANQNQMFL